MRELRACDFCGEDADGVYEPLPPANDQRRVALCASCRGTLAELLEPLTDDGSTESKRSDAAVSSPSDAGASAGQRDADRRRAGGKNADPESVTTASGRDEPTATAERNEPKTAETDSAGDGSTDSANASEQSTTAEEPPGFRKVMRLLNNRSFPLERAVAVELASGAYEFSEAEVGATLDYAVERGVLAESGGKLRRT